jgi:hypothetical protein
MRPVSPSTTFAVALIAGLSPWPGEADVCGSAASAPSAFVVVSRGSAAQPPRADTLVSVTVCLLTDARQLRVAGYHGELRLPDAYRVVTVVRPAGGTRIENSAVAGRVAFAGVAAEGLASGPLLTVVVARPRAQTDGAIRLALIDLTDLAGRDVGSRVRVDSAPRFLK